MMWQMLSIGSWFISVKIRVVFAEVQGIGLAHASVMLDMALCTRRGACSQEHPGMVSHDWSEDLLFIA
jgi:hypothetical protein